LLQEIRIHVVVSLNPIMVDGTGMCGGCRVTVAGKTRYACVDGPSSTELKSTSPNSWPLLALPRKRSQSHGFHARRTPRMPPRSRGR
jgi:succinate dehydrogenase/fumarate reductase-like Fe-S protein